MIGMPEVGTAVGESDRVLSLLQRHIWVKQDDLVKGSSSVLGAKELCKRDTYFPPSLV